MKIQAFAGNQAMPVSNVKVVVTKNIDKENIVFFEGETDSSGIIEEIKLPAPKNPGIVNNLDLPVGTVYKILIDQKGYQKINYDIIVYQNIKIIQYINLIPNEV